MSLHNYNIYDEENKIIPIEYKIEQYLKINNDMSIMENNKLFYGTQILKNGYNLYTDAKITIDTIKSLQSLFYI